MRYARIPVDLPESLGLNRLSDAMECTFWRLFLIARRRPPEALGFLVDDRLRPWSLRALSRLTQVPLTTLHRNVPQLLHQRLVESTLGGTLFLPSVLEVEHRLASSLKDHDDGRHEQRRRRERPVENQLPLPMEMRGPGPPEGPKCSAAEHKLPKAEHDLEVEVDLCPELNTGFDLQPQSAAVGEKPVVENDDRLKQHTPLLADTVLSVPPQIADPDCRYMLAKFSQQSPAWGRVLADAQERANLVRLFEAHGTALFGALQSAAFDPGLVRNPGAWLNRTVPAIAREMEVAS